MFGFMALALVAAFAGVFFLIRSDSPPGGRGANTAIGGPQAGMEEEAQYISQAQALAIAGALLEQSSTELQMTDVVARRITWDDYRNLARSRESKTSEFGDELWIVAFKVSGDLSDSDFIAGTPVLETATPDSDTPLTNTPTAATLESSGLVLLDARDGAEMGRLVFLPADPSGFSFESVLTLPGQPTPTAWPNVTFEPDD